MAITRFKKYLLNLGFSELEVSENLNNRVFTHHTGSESTPYLHYALALTDQDFYDYHKEFWNKNTESVFIAVNENVSYIVDAKNKPSKSYKKNVIKSFNYGINSKDYESSIAELISKPYINSAYFFDFVSNFKDKGQEVDKDLLLNLLSLRNDLLNASNEKTINLLILRCIFIKYLEDRGIFNNGYLANILNSFNSANLVNAFNEVSKINGDVFKFDIFEENDIKQEYMPNLLRFFTTDYRSGQGTLFPYQFNNIPIQLISHVYEAFLKSNIKKDKGIYYTPYFLVNFILKQTLEKITKSNNTITVLDPAVGSGAFLVESFRIIQRAYGHNLTFEVKKQILQNQLFGIDIDESALQITAFSLYLVLLETEEPEFIRHQIEYAHPILPSLIGNNLLVGNSITDKLFEGKYFDYIFSNPPWGSVPSDTNLDNNRERYAIDNKGGDFPEYKFVADYERSQAFLMRVSQWSHTKTILAMIVKNSIFLNDGTKNFRKAILEKYSINNFYELSHYNRIIFKKRDIGELHGKKVQIGASEPCVVVIFNNIKNNDNLVHYASPKLTQFAERFKVISCTTSDISIISQQSLIDDDNTWKVLVNSDLDGLELINSLLLTKDVIEIKARTGFQPQTDMRQLGEPVMERLIEPQDFEQFYLNENKVGSFNWNQELRRRPNEAFFNGSRIIIPVRPLKSDNLLLRGIYIKGKFVYKDNIISITLKNAGTEIENYYPYLGIINSQLLAFLFFNLSAQWGKGEGKRETLRNTDIQRLPVKAVDGVLENKLTDIVKDIQYCKYNSIPLSKQISSLNDEVFNLYNLTKYDKEIVNEFYQVKVHRSDKHRNKANKKDLSSYFHAFKSTFSLMLHAEKTLIASFFISPNIGAVIKISIVDIKDEGELIEDKSLQLLNLVKSNQLKSAEAFNILNEDKVKIYDSESFYIVKSNLFKDWTVRQAIKDAKQEMQAFVKQLLKNEQSIRVR